jgi:contact-dependent growth inhibition (CDI) system CdiA-like toxin
MAEGDLGAVLKGVADDAAQAGRDMGEAMAKLTEDTASKEEEAVARTLTADDETARAATAIGKDNQPLPPTSPGGTSAGTGGAGGQTGPSGQPGPGAVPGGRPTRIGPNNDADTMRSLQRENESARALARNGYEVEQNPSVPGSKNPDYRIEGQIFDNYAPTTGNARNIASWIQQKVDEGQADRIVLNLADSPVALGKLSAQLHDWPIAGLKEVIVIDGQGNVLHFYP